MEDLQLLTQHCRLIGWNGICLQIPSEWEVIVKGNRHLLIEHDFRQIAEIRWEPKGPGSDQGVIKAIHKTVGHLVKEEILKIPLPKPFRPLKKNKNAQGLSWRTDGLLSAIFWRFEHSNALIFCQLHHNQAIDAESLFPVLDSIQFQKSGADSLWSIQDFSLRVPETYTFTNYTLAPGLTRLAFKGGDMELQFCRLAPASEKLAQRSLAMLLSAMQGQLHAPKTIATTKILFEHQVTPSIGRQLLSRLRRKRPFHWGRIWHLDKMNRLLALTAESIRPIDPDTMHSLCAHYEILPEK